MRSETFSSKGVSVRAISGTHVVFLALNLSAAARTGCLGFAIKRSPGFNGNAESWLPNRIGFNGPIAKKLEEPEDVAYRLLDRFLELGVEIIKFWAAPRGRDRGLFVDAPWRIEAARRQVWRALQVVGGVGSPAGSCLWHVLGWERTLREWAQEQGWNGRRIKPESAAGILIAALGALESHLGGREFLR